MARRRVSCGNLKSSQARHGIPKNLLHPVHELRTKLLVWGICHQQISWSPIGFQGFVCSGHQHQGRSMQFTLWGDLICHMIEKIEGTVLHGK